MISGIKGMNFNKNKNATALKKSQFYFHKGVIHEFCTNLENFDFFCALFSDFLKTVKDLLNEPKI